MSIEIIKLSEYKRPEIKESSGQKYVLNGNKNSYYDDIVSGYQNSPTNAAIIDSYAMMMYGLGLNTDISKIISKTDLRDVCRDFVIFGEAAVEVHYKGKNVIKLYYVPKQKVAPAKHIDGEIRSWWFCEDWKKIGTYPPQEFQAYGFGDKSQPEIHVIRRRQVGQFYYANPSYLAALPFIKLEEELANYFVNHIQNGLSAGHIINLNNGQPESEEIKQEIVRSYKDKLAGSGNAGKFVLSFNDNKDTATTVDAIVVSDAHQQYSYLVDVAEQKICVAHKVISGAILGLSKSTGFSSNAEEIETAFNETLINVIQPMQEVILDDLEKLLNTSGLQFIPLRKSMSDEATTNNDGATQLPNTNVTDIVNPDLVKKEASYNGAQIASSLDIMEAVKNGILTTDQAITFLIQMLQFEPDVAKALFAGNSATAITMSKEKKNKCSHETDGIADALIELGEEIGDEWEEIDDMVLNGEPDDIDTKLNLSAHIYLAKEIPSFWDKRSGQDTSLFKVRYRYQGGSEAQREFCQKMVSANKVYRKEDITAASRKVVNPGFGAEGANKYNIWLYKGGVNCQHYWERVILMRKDNKQISVNQARKLIISLDPKDRPKAKWQDNDARVAQVATEENNHWKLK